MSFFRHSSVSARIADLQGASSGAPQDGRSDSTPDPVFVSCHYLSVWHFFAKIRGDMCFCLVFFFLSNNSLMFWFIFSGLTLVWQSCFD